MKLTAKVRYAIKTMVYLAYQEGTVTVSDVSESQGIPHRFLLHVFCLLKTGGLVESTRGPKGGFKLARSCDKITLGDIYNAIESPFDLSQGLADIPNMRHVNHSVHSIFKSFTLYYLCPDIPERCFD